MTEQHKPEASQKPERLVILSKGYGFRFERDFFVQIQAAFDNGYRFPASPPHRDDVSMRNFRGSMGKAVMFLEGCEPEPKQVAKVEAVAEPQKVEPIVVKEEGQELSTGEHAPSEIEEVEKEVKAFTLENIEELKTLKDLKAFVEDHKFELPVTATTKKLIKEALKDALKV